jgi:hypothetical protein
MARYYATRYADHHLSEEEIEARIQPVYLNVRDISEYNSEGRHWDEATDETVYFVLDEDGNVIASSRKRVDMEVFCAANGLNPDYEITESQATGDVAEVDLLNGKDGVLFENVYDGGTHPTNVWVVKENTQAKSATQNIGTFDRTNPDIRFHVGPRDSLFEGAEGEKVLGDPNPRNISAEVREAMEKRSKAVQEKNENVHTKPAERLEGTAKLIYQVLDNTHGLYLLQQKINAWRKEHGKRPIPDSMDVRSLLNRCSSAIASRVTLFDQREGKRLKDVSDKIIDKIAKTRLMEQFEQDK